MSRVLLVGKGAPDRGGISAFLASMMGSGLTTRHEVTFLNLTRDEVPKSGRLTTGNVTRTLTDAVAVLRASGDADIVHIHTALVPHVTLVRVGLFVLAARARGAQPVVHAHSGKVQRWVTTRPRRLLTRLMLLPAARVVAVSEGGRRALVEATGRPVRLIENGVAVGPPPGPRSHDGPPRVFFAGVLTPRKGVVDLLTASTILVERGVAHELILAGGTPDEGADAEAEVHAAAEGSPARFLGPQPHEAMPALYAGADVFCLPSWWEAMPLSVLEAMAAGLPVVASRVGDIPRAVEDGVSGSIVPAQDPEALADALEPLLRDAALRERMGAAGRARVESSFSMTTTESEIDAVYREIA